MVSDVDSIVDLGTQDIWQSNGNGSVDNSGFRKAFIASVRFGPNRLSRVIISVIITNIRNAANDSQVTVPGGVSFNIQLENFPFRANDTTPVLEFNVDSDVDEGTLSPNTTTPTETDDNQLQLDDNTEGRVDFNDTRKIRWKRRVFCDNNKEVVVRTRFVKVTTETPDGGLVVRKKLIVTFHISRSVRCSKLFWDPTNDIETPPDQYIEPSGTTGNPTSTTGNPTPTPTGTKTNSSVSKMLVGLLLFLIALLI